MARFQDARLCKMNFAHHKAEIYMMNCLGYSTVAGGIVFQLNQERESGDFLIIHPCSGKIIQYRELISSARISKITSYLSI